ncbi:hypothetical protein D9758_015844 [Tetrapyrgos nigripes]|uniref:Uncharacterized protein n=1 Tax=Tetrapyrgos nigripes TaxID=182062 RepID=A0A8H5FHD1_9AGAR|nr:hypothetical protein D9758_015844 [Tetrapyrgos nigripes]
MFMLSIKDTTQVRRIFVIPFPNFLAHITCSARAFFGCVYPRITKMIRGLTVYDKVLCVQREQDVTKSESLLKELNENRMLCINIRSRNSATAAPEFVVAIPSPTIAAVSSSPCLPSSTMAASNATGITARTPTSGTAPEPLTAHSIAVVSSSIGFLSCYGSSSAVINNATSGSAVASTAHDVAVMLFLLQREYIGFLVPPMFPFNATTSSTCFDLLFFYPVPHIFG